jgi:hypothetical protein
MSQENVETKRTRMRYRPWEDPLKDRQWQVIGRMVIQAGVFFGVPAGAFTGAILALTHNANAGAIGVVVGFGTGLIGGIVFAAIVIRLHEYKVCHVTYIPSARDDFIARLNLAAFRWAYVLSRTDDEYFVFESNLEIRVGAGPAGFADYNTIVVQLHKGDAYIAGPKVKVTGIASILRRAESLEALALSEQDAHAES